jgi:hypothetical protein
MKTWYVYRHIRIDNNEPFYIGIGCKDNYARAFEIHPDKRNIIWNRIYNKSDIQIEIIIEGLTKEQAAIKEQEFIKLYGRIDLGMGTLCNMTDGGDGIWNCKRTEETRQKLKTQKLGDKNHRYGTIQSEEVKIKRGIYNKGRIRSNEVKRKQSLSSIYSGQAISTEVINQKTGESLGVYHSMSEACRSVGLDPKKYSSKASMVARNLRKQCMGYIFEYKNNKTNGRI